MIHGVQCAVSQLYTAMIATELLINKYAHCRRRVVIIVLKQYQRMTEGRRTERPTCRHGYSTTI